MNWITEFVKPKIKALVRTGDDIADKSWHKCPVSGEMVFHRDLESNLWVFPDSGYHARLPVEQRFTLLFDNAKYELMELPSVPKDPLNFKDLKRYKDRLKDNQGKQANRDALQVGIGKINGYDSILAVFDFSFMGGSMGTAVGEAFLNAARLAIEKKAALIVVTASGGARMQEGALSLMQLPRTTIAVRLVKEAKLPYIVILTDPTTGGVSASFAMLGDIQIAEKGATIGFAGKRVIQQTVGEQLPENFQTSEYLLEHGMVDIVTTRHQLKNMLGGVLSYLHPAGKIYTSSKIPLIKASNKNSANSNNSTKMPKAAE